MRRVPAISSKPGHLPPEEVLIPADGFNTNNWSVRYAALGRQRQRIGLARALYHRPSLLILDYGTIDITTDQGKAAFREALLKHADKSIYAASSRVAGTRQISDPGLRKNVATRRGKHSEASADL